MAVKVSVSSTTILVVAIAPDAGKTAVVKQIMMHALTWGIARLALVVARRIHVWRTTRRVTAIARCVRNKAESSIVNRNRACVTIRVIEGPVNPRVQNSTATFLTAALIAMIAISDGLAIVRQTLAFSGCIRVLKTASVGGQLFQPASTVTAVGPVRIIINVRYSMSAAPWGSFAHQQSKLRLPQVSACSMGARFFQIRSLVQMATRARKRSWI